MGLTTWENAPGGPIRKRDVEVAKNYLTEEELRGLNRLVSQYLDFAESMAERRRPMTMAEWKEKLDAFLQVNEHDVLSDAGRISHEEAVRHALAEYEKFDVNRRAFEATHPISDLDRLIEESRRLQPPEEDV